MSEPELSEKEREERKRDRAYDPVARWKHIQETITWAEANMPPHLRRNRPRLPKPGQLKPVEETRQSTELQRIGAARTLRSERPI